MLDSYLHEFDQNIESRVYLQDYLHDPIYASLGYSQGLYLGVWKLKRINDAFLLAAPNLSCLLRFLTQDLVKNYAQDSNVVRFPGIVRYEAGSGIAMIGQQRSAVRSVALLHYHHQLTQKGYSPRDWENPFPSLQDPLILWVAIALETSNLTQKSGAAPTRHNRLCGNIEGVGLVPAKGLLPKVRRSPAKERAQAKKFRSISPRKHRSWRST